MNGDFYLFLASDEETYIDGDGFCDNCQAMFTLSSCGASDIKNKGSAETAAVMFLPPQNKRKNSRREKKKKKEEEEETKKKRFFIYVAPHYPFLKIKYRIKLLSSSSRPPE